MKIGKTFYLVLFILCLGVFQQNAYCANYDIQPTPEDFNRSLQEKLDTELTQKINDVISICNNRKSLVPPDVQRFCAKESGFSIFNQNATQQTFELHTPFMINDTAAFNNTTILVGDNGNIFSNHGQGLPWLPRQSGTVQNLNFVFVMKGTPEIIFAGGDNNILLRSDAASAGDVWFDANWNPAPALSQDITAVAPTPVNLYGAAFGNNTIVLVGSGGEVSISSDSGAIWTSKISNVTNNLNAVAFGNGKFVAVGDWGDVTVSTDNGATWTAGDFGTSHSFTSFRGVTFGKGLFVATGDNGAVLSSPNGITWTERASGTTNHLNKISFDNVSGEFITAGVGGAMVTSSDGITWTSLNKGISHAMLSVVYANNKYVAVGGVGTILTSPTGAVWTSMASGTTDGLAGVAYGNGLFVAVGGVGYPAAGTILTSPTGISWTKRTSNASNVLADVAFGNGSFAAVGMGGVIVTSTNGINWTSRTSGLTGKITGISYGNGKFVAVAESGDILTSPGGALWTKRTKTGTGYFYGVTFGNGLFVAVGSDNNSNGVIFTSPDGIKWTQRTPGIPNFLVGAAYGNNTYMAVGQSGAVLYSYDGITWSPAGSATSNWLYRTAFGSTSFVAVGYYGTIVQTNNVVDNITVTSPNSAEIWTAGQKKNITWTYAGDPGTEVNIILMKGGQRDRTIRANMPIGTNGTGTYSWTIPATLTAGYDYAIKVVSSTKAGSNDTSNYSFTIKKAPGTITVATPNGGQSWTRGTAHAINWTYTGNPGANVNIQLYKGGVFHSVIKTSVSKGTGGTGSYSWTIPSSLPAGTDYKVRIVSAAYPGISDTSDVNLILK